MKFGLPGAARSGVPNVPLSVRAACEPMDGLRGLHDAELSGAVAPEVILNEGRNAEIDGDDPPRWDIRCPQARKGDPSTILGRLAPQIHRRVNTSDTRHEVLQLPIGPTIGRVLSVFLNPTLSALDVRAQLRGLIGRVPMGAVPSFTLEMVTAMHCCHAVAF